MPLQEVDKIWFNGELVDWADAKIHLLTHALHYGTGVFEGIRCYDTPRGPAVFRLVEHMKRLQRSARMYRMDIPYSLEDLCTATCDLIKANGLKTGYIRPIVYRGYGEMGLNPMNAPIDTAIAIWPWGAYLGEEGLAEGIKVKITSFQRFAPNALPSTAKATGQYINSILAKLDAMDSGFDEALMLDFRGFISEGPGENVFMVKDSVLYTPPLYASVLEGITRDAIIEVARDMGYSVEERDITRNLIYEADECFFTGTAAEITPIRQIDGFTIGKPGPVTKKIQESFFEIAEGKNEKYDKWLYYI